MNTYEDMKKALQKLCRHEGLRFAEMAFEDDSVIYERKKGCLRMNSTTKCLVKAGVTV